MAHLSSAIPANDTRESVFGHQGWQKGGQYSYWPGEWLKLVLTGHYWSIGGQLKSVVDWGQLNHRHTQAFRFTVRPRHCRMISKYGAPLSKAVGPAGASVSAVKKSYIHKKFISRRERVWELLETESWFPVINHQQRCIYRLAFVSFDFARLLSLW